MSDQAVAGWYEDPHGRHQLRFFDGTVWTSHVLTDGVVRFDPPGGPLDTASAGPAERLRGSGSTPGDPRRRRLLLRSTAAGAVLAAAFASGALLAGEGHLEALTGERFSAEQVRELSDDARELGSSEARVEVQAELDEATAASRREYERGTEDGYHDGYDAGYGDGYSDALEEGRADDPDLPGTPVPACASSASPLPIGVPTPGDLAGRGAALYCITVPVGGRYDLNASSEEVDLTMTLIGGTGRIGYSDDAYDLDPALESRHLEPGSYELRIEPYDDVTDGSFTVGWAPAGA